jgi:DeoR/GlpR family transcriptional regulator of sugar metabolism
VADHTKIGLVASAAICATSLIDTFITDTGATDVAIAPFVAKGIEVIRV